MSHQPPDIDELRRRLQSAEQRLEALKGGSTAPPSSGFATSESSIGADWAQRVIERMPDGVALVESGVVAGANKRLATLLGEHSGTDLIGRPLPDPSEPKVGPSQERWPRTDGSMVQVEVRRSTLDVGGIKRTLVFVRDATAVAVLEAQLRQADRLAAVGSLAAGVAHQINNPLAYVITNLAHLDESMPEIERMLAAGDTIEAERRVADLREAVLEARDGAERVASIVRDLKMLSRVDDDRRVPIDVARLLDAAANIVASELGGRVKVLRDYKGVGSVVGNESRLGHVFVNLLMNAAQALQVAGDGPHELRLVTKNDPHGEMVVEISDTGPGIPPHVAARIFDPFFTTKPIGVGTGLGLTTSLGILNGMGGRIEVDSAVGAGATFRVLLPVLAVAEDVADAREPSEVTPMMTPRPRVLVIDDEITLTNALRRALQRDVEVVVRRSGADALALLRGDDRFDLVLCDIMMPEMNGIEMFELVRATNPALARRFVFMTGGAFTAETREFLDLVENARLEKPFELAALRRLIRDHADQGQ